ncbi:MAG: hypothetical protein AAB558_03450 [Patescibacteria group bacterium]
MNFKQFIWPGKWKLALFVLFLAVDYFGQVQSWAFCKECYPKPFLYDLISWFHFWEISLVISAPIRVIEWFLPKTELVYTVTYVLLVAYFYALACGIVILTKKIKKDSS